jgi:hypothetical protein
MTLGELRAMAEGCANTGRRLQLTMPWRKHGDRIRLLGSGPLSIKGEIVFDVGHDRMMAWWETGAVLRWLDRVETRNTEEKSEDGDP